MTYVPPGLLDGLDQRDARALDDRDSDLFDAERVDQYAGHEYASSARAGRGFLRPLDADPAGARTRSVEQSSPSPSRPVTGAGAASSSGKGAHTPDDTYVPTVAALRLLAERDECDCTPARGIVHGLVVGVGYLLAALVIAVVVL